MLYEQLKTDWERLSARLVAGGTTDNAIIALEYLVVFGGFKKVESTYYIEDECVWTELSVGDFSWDISDSIEFIQHLLQVTDEETRMRIHISEKEDKIILIFD